MDLKHYFDKVYLLTLATKQPIYYNSIPIRYDDSDQNSQRFKFLPQTSKNIRHLNYKTIICKILAGVQFCQCVLKSTKIFSQEEIMFDKIFGWFAFLIFMTNLLSVQLSKGQTSNLAVRLTNILEINRKVAGVIFSKINFSMLFVPMILLSCNIFGQLVVLGFHFVNPCKSSFVGFFLLEECYDTGFINHSNTLSRI